MFKKKLKDLKISGNVSPETTGYPAYAFILSPEPFFWVRCKKLIEAMKLPCFVVSHWWDDKPHYHVMVLFDESKEAAPVWQLCGALQGYSLLAIYDPRVFARGLCHLDNPDKHQYSPDDVMCFNGCVYKEIIK